jgi:hypothetical protein
MTPKTLCFPGDTVLASKERKKERNIVYFLNNRILNIFTGLNDSV